MKQPATSGEVPVDDTWASKLAQLEASLAAEAHSAKRMDLIDRALRPPEPQLLDTCVLQNLDWVDRCRETGNINWNDESEGTLSVRYGTNLANDLLDLGTLYTQFEARSGYPWLVCNAAIEEANLLRGEKGDRLRNLIDFLAGHQDMWCSEIYPGIAKGSLLADGVAQISPLVLNTLGVQRPEDVTSTTGPLAFLRDRGDRLIASHALFSNIPVVLTTDHRTFWVHREKFTPLGLKIMRPGELLDLYEPYWEALDREFSRRQGHTTRDSRSP